VGFDVLTTCQPSTVWCSRERLPAAAAQPAKVRQSCRATERKKKKEDVPKKFNINSLETASIP
jgi:hypothetical protein